MSRIRIDYDLKEFGVTLYDGIIGVHNSQDADTKLVFYSDKLGNNATADGTQDLPFEAYDDLKTWATAEIKAKNITEKYVHLVDMDDALINKNENNCIFVNTDLGDDSNNGESRATPVLTYSKAETLIDNNRTTIHVLNAGAEIQQQITVPTQFERWGEVKGSDFENNKSLITNIAKEEVEKRYIIPHNDTIDDISAYDNYVVLVGQNATANHGVVYVSSDFGDTFTRITSSNNGALPRVLNVTCFEDFALSGGTGIIYRVNYSSNSVTEVVLSGSNEITRIVKANVPVHNAPVGGLKFIAVFHNYSKVGIYYSDDSSASSWSISSASWSNYNLVSLAWSDSRLTGITSQFAFGGPSDNMVVFEFDPSHGFIITRFNLNSKLGTPFYSHSATFCSETDKFYLGGSINRGIDYNSVIVSSSDLDNWSIEFEAANNYGVRGLLYDENLKQFLFSAPDDNGDIHVYKSNLDFSNTSIFKKGSAAYPKSYKIPTTNKTGHAIYINASDDTDNYITFNDMKSMLSQTFIKDDDKFVGRFLGDTIIVDEIYTREIETGTLNDLLFPSGSEFQDKTIPEFYDAEKDIYVHRKKTYSGSSWETNSFDLKVLPFYSNNAKKWGVTREDTKRLHLMTDYNDIQLVSSLNRTDIIAIYTELQNYTVAFCASGDIYEIKNGVASNLATIRDAIPIDYDNQQNTLKMLSKDGFIYILYQFGNEITIAITDKLGQVTYEVLQSQLSFGKYMPASWYIEADTLYLDILFGTKRQTRVYAGNNYNVTSETTADYTKFLYHAHWHSDKTVKRESDSIGFSKLIAKKDPTTQNKELSNAFLPAGYSVAFEPNIPAKYLIADDILNSTNNRNIARGRIDTSSPTRNSLMSVKKGEGSLNRSTVLSSTNASVMLQASNSILQGSATGNIISTNTVSTTEISGSIKVGTVGLAGDFYRHLLNRIQGDGTDSVALNKADFSGHGRVADLGCHLRDLDDVNLLFTQSRYLPSAGKVEIIHSTEQTVSEQRADNGAIDVYTDIRKEWEIVEVKYDDVKKDLIDFYKLLSRQDVKTVNLVLDGETENVSQVTAASNHGQSDVVLSILEDIPNGTMIEIDRVLYYVIYKINTSEVVLDKPLHIAISQNETFKCYETGQGGQYSFVPFANRSHNRIMKTTDEWQKTISFKFARPVLWQ